MTTSDELVFTGVRAVVQTVADTAGHAAAATTHIIATPTRAAVNAVSAVAVSVTTFAIFTATRATLNAVWWIGATTAGAVSTVASAGYSRFFTQETQYVALPDGQPPKHSPN